MSHMIDIYTTKFVVRAIFLRKNGAKMKCVKIKT